MSDAEQVNVKRFTFSNLLLIAIAVLLSIFTAIAGFAWTEVKNHDNRIEQIEKNHISTQTIQELFKTDFNGFKQSIEIKLDGQMVQFRSELVNMEARLDKRISKLDDRIMKLYER